MSVKEYVIPEPGQEAWVELDRPDRKGLGFLIKKYADGSDGSPWAVLSIQPAGFNNPAHFHNTAQFQILLEGSVEFPAHKLEAPAVHYSDASSPYGPFVVGEGFVLGVMRQRPANQVYMSDRKGRKERNPYGRELYGGAADREWQEGDAGLKIKHLIRPEGSDEGPASNLIQCPAGAMVGFRAASAGEYQVVIEGSIVVDGKELGPYSMRYNVGEDAPSPIEAGPGGATLLTLTFDPNEQGDGEGK